MTTSDAALCVNLAEAVQFSAEARVNREIMTTDDLIIRMNCYEPGQVTPMHMHPGRDEVFYVLEGHGTFGLKDRDDLPFKAGELHRLPGSQFHQIVAGPGERTVVLYMLKRDYTSVRPDDADEAATAVRLPSEERQ